MSNTWLKERQAVADTARKMAVLGLVSGTSGNVSTRLGLTGDGIELMAITPSGESYDSLEATDIVVADFDGEPVDGELVPSTESQLHATIYRARTKIGAVVHTHSVYSSALAVAGIEVPAVIDEAAIRLGGPVRIARYAFPGSEELAVNVCVALAGRKATLMANHGAVCVGDDLSDALEVSSLLERVAEIFVHASTMGGTIQIPSEMIEAQQAIYRMQNPEAKDLNRW